MSLTHDQLLREPALEYLRRQVTALRSAQGTRGDNPAIRHGSDRGRDVLHAPFATHREAAQAGIGQVEHAESSIGEDTAKVQRKFAL